MQLAVGADHNATARTANSDRLRYRFGGTIRTDQPEPAASRNRGFTSRPEREALSEGPLHRAPQSAGGGASPNVPVRSSAAKGADYCHNPLEIASKNEGEYTLQGTITAPSRPGRYRLLLVASYSIESSSANGDDGKTAVQAIADSFATHDILGPEVEVHR